METTIKDAIKSGYLVKHGIQFIPKKDVTIKLRSGDKVEAVVGRRELPRTCAYDHGCLVQNPDGDGTFDTLFPVHNILVITEDVPVVKKKSSKPKAVKVAPVPVV
jgi:hypothetical protein